MRDHEVQRCGTYWSSLSVLERKKQERTKKRGEFERERGRRKKGSTANWHSFELFASALKVSSCPDSKPHGPKSSPRSLRLQCGGSVQRRRLGFRRDREHNIVKSCCLDTAFQYPCILLHGFLARGWSLLVRLRARPTVQWACRMEYDIDFYKHFAWLRKVRHPPLACLLLIPSHCTWRMWAMYFALVAPPT